MRCDTVIPGSIATGADIKWNDVGGKPIVIRIGLERHRFDMMKSTGAGVRPSDLLSEGGDVAIDGMFSRLINSVDCERDREIRVSRSRFLSVSVFCGNLRLVY